MTAPTPEQPAREAVADAIRLVADEARKCRHAGGACRFCEANIDAAMKAADAYAAAPAEVLEGK